MEFKNINGNYLSINGVKYSMDYFFKTLFIISFIAISFFISFEINEIYKMINQNIDSINNLKTTIESNVEEMKNLKKQLDNSLKENEKLVNEIIRLKSDVKIDDNVYYKNILFNINKKYAFIISMSLLSLAYAYNFYSSFSIYHFAINNIVPSEIVKVCKNLNIIIDKTSYDLVYNDLCLRGIMINDKLVDILIKEGSNTYVNIFKYLEELKTFSQVNVVKTTNVIEKSFEGLSTLL